MWIFGYGSLLWKTDFPYQEKKNGYIKNYVRRFWQGSLDHRGTHEKPGRVVTLIYTGDPNDMVWGTAFKVAPGDIQAVLEYLDFREKNGYVKRQIPFHAVGKLAYSTASNNQPGPAQPGSNQTGPSPIDSQIEALAASTISAATQDLLVPGEARDSLEVLEVEAYIADETNPHFLGPAPLESMAQQILTSFGVSGHNLEYLLNLWEVLKEIAPAGHHEPHINELVKTVNLSSTIQPQKSR